MRRMSFSATIGPMRNQTKTVTRRHPDTWANLEPGDRLTAIEKGMGLAKGEKQAVLGVIEIVDVRVEDLGYVLHEPPEREGFATVAEFVAVWERMNGRFDESAAVRRIEFRHIDAVEAQL